MVTIAIIGAGWYGCHIAASLQALGFKVDVFEASNQVLDAASGNNQFRLHLGFHYPRHHGTRIRSRDGFQRFIERYPSLSTEVQNNLYAVPKRDSLIDFVTYRLIMTSSGVDFTEAVPLPDWAEHLEGCLQTAERVLETERARKYFTKRLASALHLGHRVQRVEEAGQHMRVDGKLYDLVIDATWGHFYPLPFDMFFEPTLLLYYRTSDKFPALTLIDGPLCSIYPTETSGLYTLSSVPFTPIAQVKTSAEAVAILQSVSEELIAKKRIQMEDQISRYVPNFRDIFEYVGPQFSIKTKHVGMNENRSCSVHRQGRLFSVMSGKIDTIFFAVERILFSIETEFDASFFEPRA